MGWGEDGGGWLGGGWGGEAVLEAKDRFWETINPMPKAH